MYPTLRKFILICCLFCCICSFSFKWSRFSRCETWVAEDYVANALLQFEWAKKFFFDRFVWSGDEKVLDVGCGDGRLTELIAKYIPAGQVVGIDNSPSMIDYASQHRNRPNLTFVLADSIDPHFYENHAAQFDIVVSFHSLHWVAEQDKVLKGIKASLKPHGRAFLRFCSKGWDPVQEIATELCQSEKWKPYFDTFKDPIHRFSEEEYLALVLDAGLQPIRIEESIQDDQLPNREALFKQIRSWLPHVKHLETEFQKEFLDDLIDIHLLRFPPEQDGIIHLPDCYLEVELTTS